MFQRIAVTWLRARSVAAAMHLAALAATVHIDTIVRRLGEAEPFKVTDGVFTYVALGADRKKRAVD